MKKYLLILIFSLFFSTSYAQDIAMQVVSSAGGYFESSQAGVTISWTLGEVAYTTLTSSEYVITQGFQQGNLFTTDVDKPGLMNSDIRIYPNPATIEVFVEVTTSNSRGKATIELYDITGRKIDSEKFLLEEKSPFRLSVLNLKTGIYLVKVTIDDLNSAKVFKLIKE